jgi:hypothetical protein
MWMETSEVCHPLHACPVLSAPNGFSFSKQRNFEMTGHFEAMLNATLGVAVVNTTFTVYSYESVHVPNARRDSNGSIVVSPTVCQSSRRNSHRSSSTNARSNNDCRRLRPRHFVNFRLPSHSLPPLSCLSPPAESSHLAFLPERHPCNSKSEVSLITSPTILIG